MLTYNSVPHHTASVTEFQQQKTLMTTSVKKMSRGRFVCTGSLAPRGDAALDERPRRGIDGNLVDFGYYLADLSVGRRLWFSRVKGASTFICFRCILYVTA